MYYFVDIKTLMINRLRLFSHKAYHNGSHIFKHNEFWLISNFDLITIKLNVNMKKGISCARKHA